MTTDNKELTKKREELERQYKRKFDAHCAEYSKHIVKEEGYRESARQMRMLYEELFDVAMELGDPVPVWF